MLLTIIQGPFNMVTGLFVLAAILVGATADYQIGVGIADVTGPTAGVAFMGYGQMKQKGTGLHLRQWARAFILDDGQTRIVFVSVDCGMMGDAVRIQVIKRLENTYGSIYNMDNVMLSGTHTHSAPGGFLMHMLFDLPSMGFSKETFGALVTGITKSIHKAHGNLQPGKIYITQGEVANANINRSPSAYLNNPKWERDRYKYNVDTVMVQMKFLTGEGKPLGVINWFPVHPTSMNNTNTLVSSDNVGRASIKMEEKMNPTRLLGKGPFIAAFAASNLGDVSPNIMGPKCEQTGRPCDFNTSSCPKGTGPCIASGPGKNMFESTEIIADRLFSKAWELWTSDAREVKGPLKVIHQYVDMTKAETGVYNADTKRIDKVQGCLPAMGYSFAAGTTDGPGAFNFRQATKSDNPLWNIIRDFLAVPTKNDIWCHHPKPILLATGHMTFPFSWQPSIVSTQLALIGDVAIACVPGEFTTMSGRRMRDTLKERRPSTDTVIIAGLCNTYSDYITTFEEYQVQRYEGASTIYGPHTLSLYQAQYVKLLDALQTNTILERGPTPEGSHMDMVSLILPVVFDTTKPNYEFGQPTQQPKRVADLGEVVTARFVSGHPRNNLKLDDTFCTVERQDGEYNWTVVATDANWETKVHWIRTSDILGKSETEVEWTIPTTAQPGIYRLRHFGHYKYIFGGIYPYSGTSSTFEVR